MRCCRSKQKYFVWFFLIFSSFLCAQNTWLPRSPSSHLSIYLLPIVDVNQGITLYNNFEYQEHRPNVCSYNYDSLGSLLLWTETNTFTIGNNKGDADFDAYQLGVGNLEQKATIRLNPSVKTLSDHWVFQWNNCVDDKGCFVKLHVPITGMLVTSNIEAVENIKPDHELNFEQMTADPNASAIAYQWPLYPTPTNRPKCLLQALAGGSIGCSTLAGNLNLPIRLTKGKISPHMLSVIRASDITLSLGGMLKRDRNYIIFCLKGSFPTGNTLTGDYILQPLVGRAGSWGAGIESIGKYRVKENSANGSAITVSFATELLHLFRGRINYRSFDLAKNGPGSRYLLGQYYASVYNRVGNVAREEIVGQSLTPMINITTAPIQSSFDIEGTFSTMLDYQYKDWKFGIACEVWGRTREKIRPHIQTLLDWRIPNLNNYAIVGRQVSSYAVDNQAALVDSFLCEPEAKINTSQDTVQLVGTVPNVTLPADLPEGIKDARDKQNRIPAQLEEALDIAGAECLAQKSIKSYATIGYTIPSHKHIVSCMIFGGFEKQYIGFSKISFWSVGIQANLDF